MKIEAKDVTMIYPTGKKALQGINLRVETPVMAGILGPNGAGKTTLMKLLIAGLIPTKGEVILDGKPLLSQETRLKSKLGYLPQSFGLFDELTVWQFLDYMAATKGVRSKDEIDEIITKAGLMECRKTRIASLSGGQRQRVGIGQALLGSPELLILDEPTVGLDPEERVKFRNLFSDMSRDKIVLLSTHIIDDVQSICNRVLVINNGLILFDGEPSALIYKTAGHVGVYIAGVDEESAPAGCQIVSKVSTARGVQIRVTGEDLPEYAEPAEPTLEDAYLYCVHRGASDHSLVYPAGTSRASSGGEAAGRAK